MCACVQVALHVPSLVAELAPSYEERAAAVDPMLREFMFAIPKVRSCLSIHSYISYNSQLHYCSFIATLYSLAYVICRFVRGRGCVHGRHHSAVFMFTIAGLLAATHRQHAPSGSARMLEGACLLTYMSRGILPEYTRTHPIHTP